MTQIRFGGRGLEATSQPHSRGSRVDVTVPRPGTASRVAV